MGKDYKEILNLRNWVEKHFKKNNKKNKIILNMDYDLFIYNASLLFAVSDDDIKKAVAQAMKINKVEVRNGLFKECKEDDEE